MIERDSLSDTDLPEGWQFDDRAALWVVSESHNTEFVWSGNLIRVVAGGVFGRSKHILPSDAEDLENVTVDEPETADEQLNRCIAVCKTIDLINVGVIDNGKFKAILKALATGDLPIGGCEVDTHQSGITDFE